MKIKHNLMIFFVFVYVFLMIQSLSVFAELIEPSRTLEGQQKPMVRLSVFSEPHELDVLLDGVEIGKTPVISKEVTPGVHILRVKDAEKEIIILSGKSLQLRLFKDSLIIIPEKKAKAPTQPKLEKKIATEEKKTEDPNKDKIQYDHFYWPINPRGPIRHE
jgi:hypothetical protein